MPLSHNHESEGGSYQQTAYGRMLARFVSNVNVNHRFVIPPLPDVRMHGRSGLRPHVYTYSPPITAPDYRERGVVDLAAQWGKKPTK